MRQRTEARCAAVQILYQIEVLDMQNPTDEELEVIVSRCPLSEPMKEFALHLVSGYLKHRNEIDEIVSRATYNWNLKRMTPIDRNIIRAATYEMLFEDDIPTAVSINEAIELAKKYSTRTSGAFVNGVLDSIRKSYIFNKGREEAKKP